MHEYLRALYADLLWKVLLACVAIGAFFEICREKLNQCKGKLKMYYRPFLMISVLFCTLGCASINTNRNLQRSALALRPIYVPNEYMPAGIEIGLDFFSMETAWENPGETLVALIIDLLAAIGTYFAGKELELWGSDKPRDNPARSNFAVEGDKNTIQYFAPGASPSSPNQIGRDNINN